jgi:hypothetical protein
MVPGTPSAGMMPGSGAPGAPPPGGPAARAVLEGNP